MEPLPVGDFQFLSRDDVDKFDLFAIEAYGEIGYILDVDLHYPQHLHDEHKDYPLAAHHLLITRHVESNSFGTAGKHRYAFFLPHASCVQTSTTKRITCVITEICDSTSSTGWSLPRYTESSRFDRVHS